MARCIDTKQPEERGFFFPWWRRRLYSLPLINLESLCFTFVRFLSNFCPPSDGFKGYKRRYLRFWSIGMATESPITKSLEPLRNDRRGERGGSITVCLPQQYAAFRRDSKNAFGVEDRTDPTYPNLAYDVENQKLRTPMASLEHVG